MLKKILLIITLLYTAAAMAAVDVNKASAADLDGIKGIGPGISSKILDERKNGDFKDWSDFIARVSGVGEKTAARFSGEGLTVNGKKFSAAAVAKADRKAAEKAAEKKAGKKTEVAKAPKGDKEKAAAAAPATQTPAAAANTDAAPAASNAATKK